MTDFAVFFEALWKSESWPKPEPFPWQTMLAERATNGGWPEAINLPTASGKTACLDAAIFALAMTAKAVVAERRMPRRIWFVVDRRIVVDEAYERAREIAKKLGDVTKGPAREVADRLRDLSGTGRPLAVARLRGGAWRDDGWARLPSQPAIICSTVDQVGSALLFRGYGHSQRTASIFAGLASQDSMILLDEAHCAVPFLQTLRAVARFRSDQWTKQSLKTPFRFSVMSATPPTDILENVTFPKPEERLAALNHPLLRQRFMAQKLARLVTVHSDSDFISEAASSAWDFAKSAGKRRVAVMVNRVASAEQIAEGLRRKVGDAADIVLLTGRMRSLDRDAVVKRWEARLKAGSTEILDRPIIVTTTQCLEVGADFSFDALITECAGLDALRQRFGRLDRLGKAGISPAVILIREGSTREPKDEDLDPIYGRAIYETWKWLSETDQLKDGIVNFGIEAMNASISALRECDEERFRRLLAPTPDAPILLPAHLDLLCQTSPRPTPEPDITLFLHGKDRGAPEVRLVLRADLPSAANMREAEATWIETLSLIPPTSPEMLSVPLYRFRRWLAEAQPDDTSGDVEGVRDSLDEEISPLQPAARVPLLVWRGRDRSELTSDPRRIKPDDVVVLGSGEGFRGLGQSIEYPDGLGIGRLDLAERSLRQARGTVALRLQKEVFAPLREMESISRLIDLASMPELEPEEIEAGLRAVLDENAAIANTANAKDPVGLPGWLRETIEVLLEDGFRMEEHPSVGLILTGNKERRAADDEIEDDPLADEEDLASKSRVSRTLIQHTADVRSAATGFARRCLSPEFEETLVAAATGHDLGKLDYRFQLLLQDGDEVAARTEEPLAKSARIPQGRRRRDQDIEDTSLPKGFRHEFLSMQLADHCGLLPVNDSVRELTLHLIASHHGYARPFAPVVPDPLVREGKANCFVLNGIGIDATTLAAVERQALPPAHRVGSGVSDRFWRLTRRYGWWGLAYLEAIFRLADWQASRKPGNGVLTVPQSRPPIKPAIPPPFRTLILEGLDGANPLAFLTALGVVRTLAHARPDSQVGLGWQINAAGWRPILRCNGLPDDCSSARRLVCDVLANTLKLGFTPAAEMELQLQTSQKRFEQSQHWLRSKLKQMKKLKGRESKAAKDNEITPLVREMLAKKAIWLQALKCAVPSLEMALGKRLNVSPEEFREFCHLAIESEDRWVLDQLAHFGSDGCWDRRKNEIERTPFSFVNGSGHQYFLETAKQLVRLVTREQIFRALFEGWYPSDKKFSMRWNPCEDRRYALMAEDPSESEPRTIWAANLLAYFGLGLLPSVPTKHGLATVAVVEAQENPVFTWPIWNGVLSPLSVTSVLSSVDLMGNCQSRTAVGISIAFRSERIAIGSGANIKLNFTPSRSV